MIKNLTKKELAEILNKLIASEKCRFFDLEERTEEEKDFSDAKIDGYIDVYLTISEIMED